MSYWLAVIFVVVALLTSVMVHEAGHFLTARAFGMKATQFFVGFGPTLFSRRRGETEYGVKAIPAGGFVKIIGMTPFEEVEPGDEARSFHRKPLGQRVIVLVAGSTTHFLIALLLILGVAFFTPHGRQVPGLTVGTVAPCVPVDSRRATAASTQTTAGVCPAGSVASPALAAGLRRGDVVTAIGGQRVDDAADGTRLVRSAPAPTTTLTVRSGSSTRDVPVTLVPVRRDARTGGPGTEPVYALGVGADDTIAYTAPTWDQAWSQVGTTLGVGPQSLLGGTASAITKIPDRFSHLFDTASADGPQSVVGIAQISGSIGSATDIPLAVRIGILLGIVASVNFFVGVLNLLPLLPFDGGHIAVNVVDRLRNRRRARRQQERGTISEVYTRFAPVSYAFFAVITVGSLLVLTSNIVNPLRL